MNDDKYEDLLSYRQVLDYIEKDADNPIVWKFKCIVAHEGPLDSNSPSYKGSSYNVRIEWENGEITDEPLAILAADDPVTCAIYARDNDLLKKPGWKHFRGLAKWQQHLFCMANQAKLKSYRTAPKFKYGYEVPRNFNHAMELDQCHGNTKWTEATALEMSVMDNYEVFDDLGVDAKAPEGYKKICVHIVYDMKHDGRHKTCLVADGHLTIIPLESVYSGVVSLHGLRIFLFVAELNHLDTWATDITSAYLEAFTSEKVYIIAGSEFKGLEGHLLVFRKALYGLCSSGACWHERFADCLCAEGFQSCRAEPDIWLHLNGQVYEYIAVYVDDLAIAMDQPSTFVTVLAEKYKFHMKGTGPLKFHLGADFYYDSAGDLSMAPPQVHRTSHLII